MFSSALKSFSSNISSGYQISPQPVVYAGPWKIHDGKKKSTGNPASIFIFDRKALDPRTGALGSRSSSSSMKKIHDEVVERLKREASSLARLRHPSILQILEPVEETRNGGLMFATEPITASLSGLLLEKDSQEGAGRSTRYMTQDPDGTRRRRDVEIDELEIQKGLLQIGKGLEFLHESAGLIHGNLTPEAIFINAKSDWKISGLAFAGPPDASTTSSLPPLALSEVLYQDPRLPKSVQLNLDFSSPDFVMDSNVTSAADLFSLGLIIVSLYNSPHLSPIQASSNVNTYKKLLGSPATVPSQNNDFLSSRPIPKDLKSHLLPRLITRRPAQRMTAREFQQSPYFDNVLVSTIRFLESLPAKTPNEKSQFMRGLPRILPEFPTSVLERKVLGALLDEAKDRELLSLILQNVFKIIKSLPAANKPFVEKVIPRLKELFLSGGAKPVTQERDTHKEAGLMVVLENMGTITENCSGREFKDDILPLIQLGLDSSTHTLVDAALKCLPLMLPVLDFLTVKNEIFPPIASVFSKTSSLAIKIRGLEAFVVLCGGSLTEPRPDDGLSGVQESNPTKSSSSCILDKYSVQEKLVPLLKAIKTKEPAVMMAALKVFRQVGQIADTDFLALEVLPVLWSFSLGPLLNLQQFNSYISLIKTLSTRIEQEQTRKLKELASSTTESSTRRSQSGAFGAGDDMLGGTEVDGAQTDFERLVLGRAGKQSPAVEDPWSGWGSAPSPPAKPAVETSNTATFSWSTPAHSNAGLKGPAVKVQTGMNSRSVTPDMKLSAFPSLEPAGKPVAPGASTGSSFPALQPSGASPWSSSHTPASSFGGMGNGFTSPTIAPPPPPAATANYSAFSMPPPPPAPNVQQRPANLGSLNWQSSPQMGFNSGSGQGTNPPVLGFQNGAAGQSNGQQKQGLDKYASLL